MLPRTSKQLQLPMITVTSCQRPAQHTLKTLVDECRTALLHRISL